MCLHRKSPQPRRSCAPSAQHAEGVSLQPLQRALSLVRDNLTEAEAGTAPPVDQGEQIKQITRELDTMVVEAEKVAGLSRPMRCTTSNCLRINASRC